MKRFYETNWDWDLECHWCITPCRETGAMIGSMECQECEFFREDVFFEFEDTPNYVLCAAESEEKRRNSSCAVGFPIRNDLKH